MDDRLDKRKELMKQFFTIGSGYNTSAMLDEIQTLQAQLDALRDALEEVLKEVRRMGGENSGCPDYWATKILKLAAAALQHGKPAGEQGRTEEAGDE